MNKKNCMLIILLCSILIISFANSLLLFSINNNSTRSNDIDESYETTLLNVDLKASDTEEESGGGYIMDTDAIYAWIEINESGNLMSTISSEDDDYEEIPISWSFTFYETSYDSVYVSTNGYLSFGYNEPEETRGDIPGFGTDHIDLIALAWDDLNPEEGGDIYYQFFGTAPNRYLVIEYYQVVDYHDELLIGDCELILYEHGNITLQYKNLYDHIDPTIGLDHGDLTNYNYYGPDLPLTFKAINFTYDSMIDVDFGLKINENDEFIYLTRDINHAEMDNFFGTSWEANWGLFPDMNSNEIMKINITSIVDNTTHWDIDYDTWDWITRTDSFSSSADGTENILIRQEPADYPDPHNLSNTFPFILPNATAVWMARANLDSNFYDEIEYDSDSNTSIIEAYNFIGIEKILYWEARYDEEGILELIDVYVFNPYQMDQTTRIFRMTRIYNVTKPFYVGVNEGDSFEYRVSYKPNNAPPSGGATMGFDRIKVIVGVIAGEDPMLNRTPVYFDYGFFIPGYNMFGMTYNAKGFLFRNTTYSKLIYSGFIFSFIVATNINWTIFCEDIPGSTPLPNGFHIDPSISDESITYTFNSNGVLNTLSYGYQGKDYLIIYLYAPSPGTAGGDDDDDDKEEAIPGYDLFIVFSIIGIASIALVKKLNKSNK